MAVKRIYMDLCLTSWKNKINRSHIVLRGECVAMQALLAFSSSDKNYPC